MLHACKLAPCSSRPTSAPTSSTSAQGTGSLRNGAPESAWIAGGSGLQQRPASASAITRSPNRTLSDPRLNIAEFIDNTKVQAVRMAPGHSRMSMPLIYLISDQYQAELAAYNHGRRGSQQGGRRQSFNGGRRGSASGQGGRRNSFTQMATDNLRDVFAQFDDASPLPVRGRRNSFTG